MKLIYLKRIMFWLLILLAELISFKFLYVFLNFGFQAPILLTPALPLILAFNLGSIISESGQWKVLGSGKAYLRS